MSDAPLRVLIVDDEALARLRLRALVEDIGREGDPATQLVGEAEDADAALALLAAQAADVVLLDIRMPGRDGLKLAAALRAPGAARPAVVFVTAHAGHALEAFELEAADYLTKPVRRERLREALDRVAGRLRERRAAEAAAGASAGAAAAAAAEPPVLVVSERGRVLRLPLAEVLYVKAEQKYLTLRTANRAYVIDESLTELEQRLGAGFVRVHRNALVARGAMRALELRDLGDEDAGVEGWAVQVAPFDEWLAVSRRQLAAVREALGGGARAG